LLSVENIQVSYGSVPALFDVSIRVKEGEIVCLLGPNGAGKSTTLRAISGLIECNSGEIRFMSESIKTLRPSDIVKRGLVQIPEGRRLFSSLTVLENLDLGSFAFRSKQSRKQTREEVYELFPILRERRRQLAGSLSGGEQQMLAIARGLMAKPKLLMLDEPSLGLAPLAVKLLLQTIRQIWESGMPILLVEQSALQALQISSRGYIIDNGKTVFQGGSEKLLDSEYVKRAYFLRGIKG